MSEARNIYNAACAQIAAVLAPESFEYRPSKHSLVRRNHDFTREITFQSSFSEISPFQASRLLLILRFRLARRPVLWSLMPQ